MLFLLLFAEFAYADDDESECLDEIMKIGVELSNKNVKYVSQIELRALSLYLHLTLSLFHHILHIYISFYLDKLKFNHETTQLLLYTLFYIVIVSCETFYA